MTRFLWTLSIRGDFFIFSCAKRAERALQDASKKQAAAEQKVLELEKKVEKSVAPTEVLKQSQESQEREESMKKKVFICMH
jgi:phage-related minor tail protein